MALPKTPVISFAHLPDQELIDAFINAPLTTAKALIKEPEQKLRFWQLLEKNANNPKLTSAYQKVEQVLGVIPTLQTLPKAAPTQEIPTTPEFKVESKTEAFQPRKIEDLTEKELGKLENALNNLKKNFFTGYAAIQKAYQQPASELDAIARGQRMSAEFNQLLELYRGEIGQFMLDEAGNELLCSALGPVGNFLRAAHHQKIRWKMAWMKNIFNPQAIYYYLKALPDQYAFKFIKHPVNQTIGLLARSQNPLFSAYNYVAEEHWDRNTGEWKQKIETVYGFTPFTGFTKQAEKIANALDVITGQNKQPNPYTLHLQSTNTLNLLNAANKTGDKKQIHTARQNLSSLLKNRDGGGGLKGFLRNSLFHPLKRLAKNAKQTQRDPLTYLAVIIGNLVWDTAIGIVVNGIKYLGTRIIMKIPALAQLRATALRFFTSNEWLNGYKMGRLSLQAYRQAFISFNTASGAFLGAKALTFLGPQGTIAGGIMGGMGGWYYQTLLNMANNKTLMHWARYEKGVLDYAGKPVGPFKQFLIGRGPMLNIAKFLAKHPWVRFPLTGLAFGSLVAPILQQVYGIPQWLTYGTSMITNYFWTTRAFWLSKIAQSSFIARPFGQLAVKLGLPPEVVGNFFERPFQTLFKTFYESSFSWPMKRFLWSWRLNLPIQWVNKIISNPVIQRFFKNWLANPGFFMGFELIGIFHALGLPLIPAIFLGPIAGGLAWNISAFILESAFGVSKAILSHLGWLGMGIGWAGQLIAGALGFALPAWWTVTGWTLALPFAWSLVYGSVQFLSFLGGLSQFGLFATRLVMAMNGLMAGIPAIAISSAVWAIGSVVALTVFTGFVIYSGFWVPMQDILHAGPQSACFNLQTTAPQTLTPGALTEVCSKFTVKEPGLLTDYGYFEHYLGLLYLDIDDLHPENSVSKVSRRTPGETEQPLSFDKMYINPPGDSSTFTNTKYALKDTPLSLDSINQEYRLTTLHSFLSTYFSNETGPQSIFELQKQFSGVKQITNGYLDLLQQVNKDPAGTKAKLLASQTVMEKIKSSYDNIVSLLNGAQNQTSLNSIKTKVTQAYNIAETEVKEENNPFQEEINSLEDYCPFQPSSCQEQISIYKSYPGFFNNQLSSLSLLLNQLNNPQMTAEEAQVQVKNAYQQANLTLQGLTQQINALKETRDTINDIDLNPWLSILNNISGASPEEINTMLLTLFNSFFKKGYFFTPGGTAYEVCVEGKYIGPTDRPVFFDSSVNVIQPGFSFNSGYLTLGQPACTAISTVTINP